MTEDCVNVGILYNVFEPYGLVIRQRERERERNRGEREMLFVLYPVVLNLWVANQNWLSGGFDNFRIFFLKFFWGK